MKTYRGQSKAGAGLGRFILGKGVYTTTSKAAAKEYAKLHGAGEVVEVENAVPTNPIRFDSYEAFQGWLFEELDKLGMNSIREFNAKYPDPGTYIASLGYDGVQIGNVKNVDYVKYHFRDATEMVKNLTTIAIRRELAALKKHVGSDPSYADKIAALQSELENRKHHIANVSKMVKRNTD